MSQPVTDYTSWGRTAPVQHAGIQRIFWRTDRLTGRDPGSTMLPFGNGRSYGDVCLNGDGFLIDTRNLDRFIDFDPENGILRCEAGITFGDILDHIVPHGWSLPVLPGTRYITLGGAIANDIHGKNHHHAGTFGRYIRSLEILRSDGTQIVCSPSRERDWYQATIGGLGLTGLILSAELSLSQIPGAAIEMVRTRFDSLENYFEIAAEADEHYPFTVGWMDSLSPGSKLGRGVLTCGTPASGSMRRTRPSGARPAIGIPVYAPNWLLNTAGMRAFNKLYVRLQPRRPTRRKVSYQSFFFPLDSVGNWNRLYGRRGFYQHQSVLPFDAAYYGVKELLMRTSRSTQTPFLTVVKTFGSVYSPGMLSFPRPGVTLALDFPNRGKSTLALLRRLDDIVIGYGGAIYPAKDACMSPATFKASFPEWERFRRFVDPNFSSDFWRRVTAREARR